MTRLEQLMLQMGIDNSQVAAGMNRFEKQVADGAKKAAGKMAGSFRSAFSGMMGAFSVAGLMSQLSKVAERVERIGDTAAALQISTKFLQDIQNVGIASGVAAEKVEGMLAKFANELGPGQDLETEFYKWADGLAAIEDPALRAQAAMERFGKAGLDMLKIAGDGSVAIKELASQFATFDDTDIATIKEANLEIEKLTNQLTVYLGKSISAFAWISRLMGVASARNGDGTSTGSWWNTIGQYQKLYGAAQRMGRDDAQAEIDAKGGSARRSKAAAAAARAGEAQSALAEFDAMLAADTFKNASPSQKIDILYGKRIKALRAADKSKSPMEAIKFLREAKWFEDQIGTIAASITTDPAAAGNYQRIESPPAASQDQAVAEYLRQITSKLNTIAEEEPL